MRKRFFLFFMFITMIFNAEESDLSFLIPKDNETLYCIAGSKEENEILSFDTSNAKARVTLANFVKERLSSILKDILANFNAINNIPEYEIAINNITEEIYNIVLYNSNDDRSFYNKKDGFYYVRVIFDIKIMKENFEKIVRNNADLLIKLKMNRPLKEFILKLEEIKSKNFYNEKIFIIY
ncbi:MAG TPA: hypothetical protein PLE45_10810 [Spirochaetota bacterium]|nr:hypothetical protein [Spirochaetota bacterium]HOL57861.1 hypothetical protein [Spirochaetota bacterium]